MPGSCAVCQVAVLILACSKLVAQVEAQNCGIPQLVVVKSGNARECISEGTILADVTVKNVVSVTENDKIEAWSTFSDFLALELIENGDNASLILRVNKSLCDFNSSIENHVTEIDSTWVDFLQIKAVLTCRDGREKLVTFNLPVEDENTQPPIFQQGTYQVTMGPCINGTHNSSCPLNFETSILVYDRDRDEENAEMDCLTDHPSLISCTVSEVDLTPQQSTNLSFSAHWKKVLLYLREDSSFTSGMVFPFNLTVFNALASPISGEHFSSIARITIIFNDTYEGELLPSVHPPQFNSQMYYSTLVNLFDMTPGTEIKIQPFPVFAQLKFQSVLANNDLGYDEPKEDTFSNFTNLDILYEISTDIFHIDQNNGKIYLVQPGKLEKKTEAIFQISAYPKSFKFLESSVPLLVQVRLDSGNATESPICSSTPTTPPYSNFSSTTVTSVPTTVTSTTSATNPWTTDSTSISTSISTELDISSTNPGDSTTPATDINTSMRTTITSTVQTSQSSSSSDATDPTHPTTDGTEIPTMEPSGVPTKETSEMPTTESSGVPSTESSRGPSTESSRGPSTESSGVPTMGTSEMPTTEPSELPTTESAGGPPTVPTTDSSELPTSKTSKLPITDDETQSSEPWTATTDIWTSDPSSEPPKPSTEDTTETFPTSTPTKSTSTRPEYDECCYCPAFDGFKCPDNVPENIFLPDRHKCNKFYSCADTGNTTLEYSCDIGQTFCPSAQGCTLETDCQCEIPEKCKDENGDHIKCPDCTNDCFRGDHPSNHCKNQSAEYKLADPTYYDIFHHCAVDDDPSGFMKDCWQPCPGGTYFCESLQICGRDYDCDTDFEGKIPFTCNMCPNAYARVGIFLDYAYFYNYI